MHPEVGHVPWGKGGSAPIHLTTGPLGRVSGSACNSTARQGGMAEAAGPPGEAGRAPALRDQTPSMKLKVTQRVSAAAQNNTWHAAVGDRHPALVWAPRGLLPPARPSVRPGRSNTGAISVLGGPGKAGRQPRGEALRQTPRAHLRGTRPGAPSCCWPGAGLARPRPHPGGGARVWAQRLAGGTSEGGHWCWRAGRAARAGLVAGTPPRRRPRRPHLKAQDGDGHEPCGARSRGGRRRPSSRTGPARAGPQPDLPRENRGNQSRPQGSGSAS